MAPVAAGFQLRAEWRSAFAHHVDTLHLATGTMPGVAAARALMGSEGDYRPLPGFPMPPVDPERRLRAPAAASGEPWRRGRFYPASRLPPVPGRATGSGRRLLRCLEADAEGALLDGNHPLAGREVQLRVRGLDEDRAEPGRLGAAIARLLDGPGMQGALDESGTDFGDPDAWQREDEGSDRRFYAPARLVTHLDAAALVVLSALHERLLPRAARVLDLMASWRSHLPPGLSPRLVAGLGMNEQELAANPQLGLRLVHDLNRRPALPFGDHSFDCAVCSVSVDYLCRPAAVFAELARVLVPGGLLVVTFSDRCFPTKAVRLWRRLLDFERVGLVLDLLYRAGFAELVSWSLRGLPRRADDRHAGNSLVSDPLYAVWGRAPRGGRSA